VTKIIESGFPCKISICRSTSRSDKVETLAQERRVCVSCNPRHHRSDISEDDGLYSNFSRIGIPSLLATPEFGSNSLERHGKHTQTRSRVGLCFIMQAQYRWLPKLNVSVFVQLESIYEPLNNSWKRPLACHMPIRERHRALKPTQATIIQGSGATQGGILGYC